MILRRVWLANAIPATVATLIAFLASGGRAAPTDVGLVPPQVSSVVHPQWSHNLSIYEVNLRQFTPSGTFKEFENHVPRLSEMGVGILWFMPIYPIGEKNRKGSLGSYYSVRDYRAVNPEFGTMEQFKELVRTIHASGMYVILDWVANHCAWDNPLVAEHPDWFTADSLGRMIAPVPDWHDVVDFNYENTALRDYMIESMRYWLLEADVDGFRCDVAGMVPWDFWQRARQELEQFKPVFMLAEDENPEAHRHAFDMTYAWELHRLMMDIARGRKRASDLERYFNRQAELYLNDAYRMNFTDNHDENSWNGTVLERMGAGLKTFAVLTATVPGMPLIYSGQETGLNKRLRFFDKDTIDWREDHLAELYHKLFHLKREHPALWNGEAGGEMQRIRTTNDKDVFAFLRQKGDARVLVLLNLSPKSRIVRIRSDAVLGDYRDVFGGDNVTVAKNSSISFDPWGYKVYAH